MDRLVLWQGGILRYFPTWEVLVEIKGSGADLGSTNCIGSEWGFPPGLLRRGVLKMFARKAAKMAGSKKDLGFIKIQS